MIATELTTSGWTPSPTRLPPETRIYAIGDIHGRADLLQALLERIARDLNDDPIRMPMAVFLGDYIDRGPNSAGVIELVLMLKRQLPTICLAGNHELYALRFLQAPHTGLAWFEVGGRETLMSYGVSVPWHLAPPALTTVSEAFANVLPNEHFYFLSTLGLTFCLGGYLFAHAGIASGTPVAEQDQAIVTLTRTATEDPLIERGVVLVHGHTPTNTVVLDGNKLNIDTGAYVTGRLSCLVIEDCGLRLL
ncbi:metallophosphoesterase family protein [Bosea sp. ASV33]|uniref:metallophosphoesterase family protein n=1 Tax=Bosea sp. ASV33 TaxID=2795106 RepID=UPI0018EB9D68|nr:metallophosphoesterase family protein [Bosea sp. ASV33]